MFTLILMFAAILVMALAVFAPQRFRLFLIQHRRMFAITSAAFACLTATLWMSGCAGTFLGDASGVLSDISAVLALIPGVLALIPGAGSVLAAVTEAVSIAAQEIQELQTLVSEYTTTPSETLLQKIEAAIQLANANLAGILAPFGIPSAFATKIGTIVQACLDEFESWAALIAQLKVAPVASDGSIPPEAIEHALATIPRKPSSAKQFHEHIAGLWKVPTGDPNTDAAFVKVTV